MPEKLERCVADVKKQGNVDNPWAVCTASIEEIIHKQIIESSLNRRRGCGCQKKKKT